MILSRGKGTKSSKAGNSRRGSNTAKKPVLSDFIKNRDFTGAMTLLEFERNTGEGKDAEDDAMMWLAYSAFHLGNFTKAHDVYTSILAEKGDVRARRYCYRIQSPY